MNILFIGNFQNGPGGEPADETHLSREMAEAGNVVFPVNRDEWREYVIEGFPKEKYGVPESDDFDIAIIAKWHHFYDGRFIKAIKEKYKCPVFYWVWDNMEGHSLGDWHMNMAKEADLYLSGELGLAHWYRSNDVKFYYFQFDSTDKEYPTQVTSKKIYDVVFLGSATNQNGRFDLLKEINKEIPITVFGFDYEQFQKEGFKYVHPPVYKNDFNRVVSQSSIILGTSAGPRIFGYWSNRVGKVLHAGGFLLQLYTPGMETYIGPSADYFSTAKEAIEKCHFYLDHPEARNKFLQQNAFQDRDRWTSEYKVQQLLILIDRYLTDPNKHLWQLP